jgi:hypothetical protein
MYKTPNTIIMAKPPLTAQKPATDAKGTKPKLSREQYIKLLRLMKKKKLAQKVAELRARDNGDRLPIQMHNRQAHGYKPLPKSYNHDPSAPPTGAYKDKMQDWRFQQGQLYDFKDAQRKRDQEIINEQFKYKMELKDKHARQKQADKKAELDRLKEENRIKEEYKQLA